MKNVFLGSVIMLCGVIFLVVVMTLGGKQLRQNELNRAVDGALEETVENQFNAKTYSVNNTNEFVVDFMETLLVQINSDSTIEIKVLDADYEKGLISVEVIEHFAHPVGTQGSVSVKRTVIMEQYTDL